MLCRLLADVLLLLHASFVAFVVLGWVAICIGKLRGWAWVRHPWFRGAHLIAIAIVVLLSWLGALCPLTALEMELRSNNDEFRLNLQVKNTGRVALCSDNATYAVPGYRVCQNEEIQFVETSL